MGGALGAVIAAVCGGVIAVVAAVGVVTTINSAGSAPVDKPFVVYGSNQASASS